MVPTMYIKSELGGPIIYRTLNCHATIKNHAFEEHLIIWENVHNIIGQKRKDLKLYW